MQKTLRKQKWSRRELILFLERLELYVSSGLALNKALEISIQGVNKKHATMIGYVQREVENGNTLAKVLSCSIVMPSTVLGLIAHGESSGQLAKALNFSKLLLEREDELVKKCLSAMTYPVVIGLFALAMTIGLMKGVMPQIIPMLKSLHVQLPLITKIVMAASDMLSSYGLFFLFAPIVVFCLLIIFYSKVVTVRNMIQSVIFRIPMIGHLAFLYSSSVLFSSLGSLIESGIPSASAYRDTVLLISFWPLKKACQRHIEDVSKGVALGSVISKIKRLPAFVPSLVSAGELTGTLGASLSRCAAIMDRDIEYALKKLTSMVEPVMMAGMGCAVGAIALSIMLPIYDVSKVLQH